MTKAVREEITIVFFFAAKYLGERTIEIGNIKYIECAYGWDNINI